MTKTLATEQQAEAIKQRMAEIRTELPHRADQARHRVKELTDWKYHMARHSIPILAATALAGYLLVPSKRTESDSVGTQSSGPAAEPAKKGLVAGLVGTLATIALKQATSVASAKIAERFRPPVQ